MKILYLDWNSYGRQDVLDALTKLGHSYKLYPLSETAKMAGSDKETVDKIIEVIKKEGYDFAFSMNYFPMVSNACENVGLPYISWIYDSPYQKGYSASIVNNCNYIITFDSAMYQELAAQGVTTVYYAPMAANVERMTKACAKPVSHDISFVGSLYNEDHNFYDEFVKNAKAAGDDYTIGFVDSLIHIQRHLYGTNILAESLPHDIATCGYASINEWTEQTAFFTTPEQIFADNVICRKIAELDRHELLSKLSQVHDVALYTRDAKAVVGNCHNYGYADYSTDCPAIFQNSKINLNISLRSIRNGIPLRAIEIMGAGGFLLTNYQSDFLMHFEPDVDFVYYENMEDALEKATYYLEHEKERIQIAANGLAKIKEAHTYEIRINEMLSLL